MPRFALLIHDHPFLHWDLLFENGDACRTWRLLTAPDSIIDRIPAEKLVDHRLMYLDYEGPVSGDRGSVHCWDRGTFDWQRNDPDLCEVVVAGSKWNGRVRLEQVEGDHWNCQRSA